MKVDATSGNPTKISTDTDSQSQNSRKRKMSEFSCNPGMQKHELFFLLLLISTLLYLKGEVILRLFKGCFFYRACYRLRLEMYYIKLMIVKLIESISIAAC